MMDTLICAMCGHQWGRWSAPRMTESRTIEWRFDTTTTVRETVQYRTCDRCGLQQRRCSEEDTP